jgi:YfiH family protein
VKIKSAKIIINGVDHGFFGRKYGKSEKLYASLNCSKFVGDDDASVSQNLDIVKNEIRSRKLITLHQVHSNLCITVDQKTKSDIKADAMVTSTPGVAIGILTADCAPVLFLDRKNRIIGAAHVGWRGAASGIIKAAVQKMIELGTDPRDVIAAVGPCIQKESYEVDDNFRQNFSDADNCFHHINHKMHFDLPKYCQNLLRQAGLDDANIDVIAIDTYIKREDYFSYRFATINTGKICGRNISAICLVKENGNNPRTGN